MSSSGVLSPVVTDKPSISCPPLVRPCVEPSKYTVHCPSSKATMSSSAAVPTIGTGLLEASRLNRKWVSEIICKPSISAELARPLSVASHTFSSVVPFQRTMSASSTTPRLPSLCVAVIEKYSMLLNRLIASMSCAEVVSPRVEPCS